MKAKSQPPRPQKSLKVNTEIISTFFPKNAENEAKNLIFVGCKKSP